MKKVLIQIIRSFLLQVIGQERVEGFITNLTRLADIDLLLLAYRRIGILKYWDDEVSGENFVITEVFRKYIQDSNIVIFDVGANIGNYTQKVRAQFPTARIYAFEPNPTAFGILTQATLQSDVSCFRLGLSSKQSEQKIYTYSHDTGSEHTSLYKNVLLDLHHAEKLLEIDFSTTTLDLFCKQHQIDHIHFLKIDTEGHEFDVLVGAKGILSEGRVDFIQFEFNEMNIISRVFLKDFYPLLNSYYIYRLDSNRLIPLFEYSSTNEIFKFQNLLAIHKKFGKYI